MAARKRNAEEHAPIPDPGITVGERKLLQRTDGKWCAHDERRPPGEHAVYTHKDKQRVIDWMKEHEHEPV